MLDKTISDKQMENVLAYVRPRDVEHAIEETVRAINYNDEQIRLNCDRMVRIAARVRVSINQGASINELGEFQNTAQEIDRHIALRAAAYQMLGALIGSEASKLATARFVRHLVEAHDLKTPLDATDLASLRAQHQVAMEQNQDEVRASCGRFYI